MVAAAQRPAAALVTWGAVAGATLSPALVPLAAPGLRTLGVTQVLLMTGNHSAVAATPAASLHLLSAGLTVAVVTPRGAGVYATRQHTVTRVPARAHLLRARTPTLGLAAGTLPLPGTRAIATWTIVTHTGTGVVTT